MSGELPGRCLPASRPA